MVRTNRRVFLGATAATLALGGTAASKQSFEASSSDAGSGPWPQYQGDATNTGFTDAEGPGDYLDLDWKMDPDDLGYWGVRSGPVLVNGTLYFASMEEYYASDEEHWDGFVHAVDASDGSQNWRASVSARHDSSTVVVGGRVFVGDGALLALDAESGSELWRSDEKVLYSPTFADGTLYAATDSGVAAFDPADGSVEWTFDPATEDTDWEAETTPAVAGDTVYASITTRKRGALCALASDTGEERWRVEFSELPNDSSDSMYCSPPVVADGMAYVSAGSEDGERDLYAFDAETSDERWAVSGALQPTVAGDTVYAVANSGISAFDAETGDERWTTELGINGDLNVRGELVVASDRLYACTHSRLYVIDAETGEALDRASDTRDRQSMTNVSAAPAVGDGDAYVVTYGENDESTVYGITSADEPDVVNVSLDLEEDGPHCVDKPVAFEYDYEFDGNNYLGYREDAITEYEWKVDYGDGEETAYEVWESPGPDVEHIYDEPGRYEVEMTFRDEFGNTSAESTTVEIAECKGPIAQIETDPAEPTNLPRGTDVELTGSVRESDVDSETYEWDVDDDGDFEQEGQHVRVTIGEDRNNEKRTITLRVTDAAGETDTASVTVSSEYDEEYEGNC
ncbi:outer membrane protein assembly factor BamB family protein [Natronorubrum halophilum]|uniref:outer membrane protein assembly factor BamB family protein n=1 Tax=Natronorubrum halophilum TaxID=1702106 RepID=UPI0010C159EB|nr:PQQ-binding-like beta-propeller repeat protein [Natronorubrum halophilum]